MVRGGFASSREQVDAQGGFLETSPRMKTLEANAKSVHAQPGSGPRQDKEEVVLLEMLKGVCFAPENTQDTVQLYAVS